MFDIRLGPAGRPISFEGNFFNSIPYLKKIGLNAVEIEFTRKIWLTIDEAKKIGKIAKKYDVELSIHCPYWINLASETKKIIEDSKKRIIDSLERGVAMGATVVAAHAGYYGKDKDRANQMVFEACKEITEHIEKHGWKIDFGLETMGKQKSWGTLDEIINVCKKLRHLIPYLDAAHLYALGGGQIDYKEVFDKLEVLNLEKIHSHFSGIKYSLVGIGRGNEKQHVPMKMAGPDFEGYAKEILKRNKDITIISESPILEIDSLAMKEMFEKLGYRF